MTATAAAPPGPAVVAGPERRSRFAAFRSSDFAAFWTGGVISSTGSQMQLAALAWVVAEQTRSGTRTLLLVFLGTIPLVVLSPVGGHLADRFPRRRLMLWTTAVQTVIAFALWWAWMRGAGSYWVLAVFSILGGTAGALNSPAWQALVPELVPRTDLRNAVMLNSAQFNIARATGPAIAGVMIDGVGNGPVFLANAVSFLAVIVALVCMSESPPREHLDRGRFVDEWRAGCSTPAPARASCWRCAAPAAWPCAAPPSSSSSRCCRSRCCTSAPRRTASSSGCSASAPWPPPWWSAG